MNIIDRWTENAYTEWLEHWIDNNVSLNRLNRLASRGVDPIHFYAKRNRVEWDSIKPHWSRLAEFRNFA